VQTWHEFLSYSNLGFTILFAVEAVLRVTAIGPIAFVGVRGWHARNSATAERLACQKQRPQYRD
jgi:hypothetical protein